MLQILGKRSKVMIEKILERIRKEESILLEIGRKYKEVGIEALEGYNYDYLDTLEYKFCNGHIDWDNVEKNINKYRDNAIAFEKKSVIFQVLSAVSDYEENIEKYNLKSLTGGLHWTEEKLLKDLENIFK